MKSQASRHTDDCLRHIPWFWFGGFTLSLPLIGLLFCVVYSVLYDFEETNATHCKVYNFLPSISATAGSKEPQMSVWKWCINIHTLPRYVICASYGVFYSQSRDSDSCVDAFTPVVIVLNFTEITALFLLTLVSSASNHLFHVGCFVVFVICSILYMYITNKLHTRLCTKVHSSPYGHMLKRSLRWKKIASSLNFLHVYRSPHPGRAQLQVLHVPFKWSTLTQQEQVLIQTDDNIDFYSIFSLCEYLLVITNIVYHSTAIADFNYHIQVTSHNAETLFSDSYHV